VRKDYKDVLFPLKGKVHNKMKIFGFDVETEHIPQSFRRRNGNLVNARRQDFVMGSLVGDNVEKVFWDREEMADHLLKKKYNNAYLLATNLEFDWSMLYYDRSKEFFKIHRHSLLAAIKTEDDNKHIMLDTLNYIKAPLSKLGDIVGVKKLGKPKVFDKNPEYIGIMARKPRNDDERQELIDYNVNDSLITYKTGMMFRDFCTKHNMKMKYTIGSVGLDYWRRNWQPYAMKREPECILRKHFEGSFRGGATVTYKRGSYDDRLWYYDYRSAYWGCMKDGVDGKGNYPHPSTHIHTDRPTTELIETYEGICKASIKIPYSKVPFMGYKSDKLLFPYGTMTGWFTNYELRKLLDIGGEVNPLEMIYYHDVFKPFCETVKYLHKLRSYYKKKGHPYQAMVKTLGHSGLFGKWGSNFMNMEELIDMDDIHFGEDGQPYKDGMPIDNLNILPMSNPGNGLASIKKEIKPFKYSFPILSSYTTMLGRMKLFDDVSRVGDSLVMTDTDSAVLTKPLFQEGDGLGDWELEHVCDGGVFIRPKMYMIRIGDDAICKNKGVGKFTNTSDTFMSAIHTGGVRTERFTKMVESSRMGIKSGTVIELFKRMGLEDDKRIWEKEFDINDWQDSEPHELRCGLTKGDQLKAVYDNDLRVDRDRQSFINSDLFDKHSVGSDISAIEFLDNEMDVRFLR